MVTVEWLLCFGMDVLVLLRWSTQALPQLTTTPSDIPSSTASYHPDADEELVGLSPEIPASHDAIPMHDGEESWCCVGPAA
jgi:hypothetical protein